MTNAQMELGFGTSAARRALVTTRRQTRASWWFARMRQVVEHAFEWRSAPTVRPEQIWFSDLERARSSGRC